MFEQFHQTSKPSFRFTGKFPFLFDLDAGKTVNKNSTMFVTFSSTANSLMLERQVHLGSRYTALKVKVLAKALAIVIISITISVWCYWAYGPDLRLRSPVPYSSYNRFCYGLDVDNCRSFNGLANDYKPVMVNDFFTTVKSLLLGMVGGIAMLFALMALRVFILQLIVLIRDVRKTLFARNSLAVRKIDAGFVKQRLFASNIAKVVKERKYEGITSIEVNALFDQSIHTDRKTDVSQICDYAFSRFLLETDVRFKEMADAEPTLKLSLEASINEFAYFHAIGLTEVLVEAIRYERMTKAFSEQQQRTRIQQLLNQRPS